MTASVKLAAQMPGGVENNGVDPIRDDLVADPTALRVGAVWFDVVKVTTDIDTGAKIPTIRVKRFEPLGDVDGVTAALRDLIQEAVTARLGDPLPFDEAEVTVEGDD